MLERTLFYKLPLEGQGTAEVESLMGYIERLAVTHHMKPRAALELLFDVRPLHGLQNHAYLPGRRSNVGGMGELGKQLRERMEWATGTSLEGSTMEGFEGLLSARGLLRNCARERAYCPQCVQECDGLPISKLIWDVKCVTVCPSHAVRLRSGMKCGAPREAHLPIGSRPSFQGVCSYCGSVGFRCLPSVYEAGSEDELWISHQVQHLLTLSKAKLGSCTAETVRAGISEVVSQAFGGFPVTAAKVAGLARNSVRSWMVGESKPSLPALLQFCRVAGADICSVLAGRPRFGKFVRDTHRPLRRLKQAYKRASVTQCELKARLEEELRNLSGRSVLSIARELGMHRDLPRKLFPELAGRVSEASAAHRDEMFKGRAAAYKVAYSQAVERLAAKGLSVTLNSVQNESGLHARTTSALRLPALKAAIEEHRARQYERAIDEEG